MADAILYNDPIIKMSLIEVPASKGHIRVAPTRDDVKSLQDLNAPDLSHLFFGASYAATALFELLGAQGTNIIMTEGDGIVIDVVARSENDGLNFLWQPNKGDPNELDAVANQLKDAISEAAWARDNPEAAAKANSPKKGPEAQVIKADDGGDEVDGKINYLLRSLRRTP